MLNKKRKNILKIITERLVLSYHPKKIILFGSYAYGKPTQSSDFDIMIIVDKSSIPQYKRSRKGYSQLRDIPMPIEIIVMTEEEIIQSKNVITSLAYKILQKGVILYG